MNFLFGIIGVVIGFITSFIVKSVLLKHRKNQIINDAIKEGENLKQNKILQAKEKFLQLKEDHETQFKDRERKIHAAAKPGQG